MRRSFVVNAVLAAAVGGTAVLLGACSNDKAKEPEPIPAPAVVKPGPAYAEVAVKYNANVEHLSKLFSFVVVQIEYTDKKGERHHEQGEGRLQVIQPYHVAISVGKVGETFFWLGSDSQRYWWLDLSGKPRVMFVGAHETYAKSQARRVGAVVAPLDLVRLIGVVPLAKTGQTQWSADGKRVGIVNMLDNGGRERVWVDPKTYLPSSIEIFNAKGELEITSTLSEPDGVTISGMGERPTLNRKIEVKSAAGDAWISLTLSDMEDGSGRMVPESFDPAALAKHYRVDTIYDLDAPPKASPSASSSQSSGASGH